MPQTKKKPRAVSSFLKKTYELLNVLFVSTQNDENQDVVRWAPNGIGFIVLNEDIFSKDVLPRYFKHSNYSSFVRQVRNSLLSSTCTTFIKFERTTLKVISIINALIDLMRKNWARSRENRKKRKEKMKKLMRMLLVIMRKSQLWDSKLIRK